MSIVAEFACRLHESSPHSCSTEHVRPAIVQGRENELFDMRAVIFDVYGTLVNYWRDAFASPEGREQSMLAAFGHVITRFELGEVLTSMNPAAPPERTLFDFYHGLIELDHAKSRKGGIEWPEVRIEQIWGVLLMMLRRNGYDATLIEGADDSDSAKCMAYMYHFHALGRGLYPGVVRALKGLAQQNIKLGIVTNAQFYTPLDLCFFLRDQSDGGIVDYLELFDTDLVFLSSDLGRARPDPLFLRRLYDALHQYSILPSQTLFAGNDLRTDIAAAADAGMKTALFCGDSRCTFLHDLAAEVVPDLVFSSFDELASLIRFHASPGDRS